MKTFFAGSLIGLALFGCGSNSAEPPATEPNAVSEAGAPAAASPNTATTNPAPTVVARTNSAPSPEAPKPISIPAGTEISVILIDSLSSDKNKAGDQFAATLADPLVIGSQTALARGTKVQGRVVDAQGAGRVKGLASMRLVLTSFSAAGKTVPVVTQPFVSEAEATKGRDAAVVGGETGIGAAIGAIAGGKGGAGKGAIIGAAAGAGTVLATKGNEVEFASESRIKFKLDKAVEVPRG